jgi:uncharacterized membrane protein YhaH (DUF805 family)
METSPPVSTQAYEPGLLATAFTSKGRAGRLLYLIYLMSYFPLIMILGLFGPLYVIGIPIVVANYVCATIRRCHDIGLSGWWALVLGLPGLNLALLVIPGGATNRFGEPPIYARGERPAALVMLLLLIAACGAYYLYIFRPAIQAYETRNAIDGPPWEKRSGESPITRLSFTSPTAGSITLDTGQHIPMEYRARYRTLYLSFTFHGVSYVEQVQHNVQSDRLELLDGDAIIGTYER